jgi:hypothetical protein
MIEIIDKYYTTCPNCHKKLKYKEEDLIENYYINGKTIFFEESPEIRGGLTKKTNLKTIIKTKTRLDLVKSEIIKCAKCNNNITTRNLGIVDSIEIFYDDSTNDIEAEKKLDEWFSKYEIDIEKSKNDIEF